MSVFAIADLHLSHTVNKPMDIFGSRWNGYTEKIEKRWRAVVSDDDTVIIPGDISWAMKIDEALEDFKFIDSLPGRKLIGKGNHDYWWSTMSKLNAFISENNIKTIDFLYNNAFIVEDYIVTGTRGWYVEEKFQNTQNDTDYSKIVAREAMRLELGLEQAIKLKSNSTDFNRSILVFLHFPPVFGDFVCDELIQTLLKYNIKNCYYGHIHGKYNIPRTFDFRGISFTLISADFLDFIPMIIMPVDF